MEEFEKGVTNLQALMEDYATVLAKATGESDGMLHETVSRILADIDKYEDKGCLKAWVRVVIGRIHHDNCKNQKHPFIDGKEYIG